MPLKKNNAFLLMELLVVFAIMAFAACLPVWYFSFNSYALEQELKTLRSWLLAIQQKAMITGADITVTIDTKNDRFNADNESYILQRSITFGYKPGTHGPPSKPTELLKDSVTFKNREICFFHDGAMHVGTCYFIDDHEQVGALTGGLSLHGTIRCYKLLGQQWNLIG
jgi:hypothetical protein